MKENDMQARMAAACLIYTSMLEAVFLTQVCKLACTLKL